ncbi:uncharacterized membrane protein YcaP (DUF421 family) [Anaerospora hongkongensis]|uniref:Uncharacterized membrane protein YcaP (DUF421 family) n=1 Tax=Anaerospora hongkongensis TaxID=244830 RepID=A0A4R1PMC3_9FIRM|nr:DUF421 domain-containing protein [Anaerospora hongkongensis]TCL32418.1 uncharacterized membrane protein YcaP (DUF421 family) [Anaerospora hongkongensis]
METLGGTAFHAIVSMAVMLLIWLVMGKRQIGELSPFDFAVSITAGTVVGAGIVDPRIELSRTIVALVVLGLLQIAVSWVGIKFRKVHKALSSDPTVLVENGQIIKANLAKVRVPVEMLLQMLREKDVFDITEVEVAIFEPHGKLSVLKKSEYSPVTPQQLNLTVGANKILVPIILEGELQADLLKKIGFSPTQIEEFHQKYRDRIDDVFIAFMDKQHNLHITEESIQESDVFLH